MAARRKGRGQVIALEGISGSGKTTVAPRLGRALDAEVLPEAYARLRPRPSLTFGTERGLLRLERRLLEEDAARYREADQIAGGGGSVVLDTGFLGPLTYILALGSIQRGLSSACRELLRSARALEERYQWGLPDRVLWLDTTAATRLRRIRSDPEGHPPELADRHEQVGLVERRIYFERLAPAFGGRLNAIDANGPPDEVADRLERSVAAGPRGFAPEGLSERVLRALESGLG